MFHCPKCSFVFKRQEHYYRHIKRFGTTQHRVHCPHCSATFSRKDAMRRHLKQQHPGQEIKSFTCSQCQKTFHHQENLLSHQKTCGKSKQFKCPHPGCGKRFSRKAMMEYHWDHDHSRQSGSGLKRKLSEEVTMAKKYLKGEIPDLPDTISVKSIRPDKEVTAAKGAKIDAFFYPQTKGQQHDLKIFL